MTAGCQSWARADENGGSRGRREELRCRAAPTRVALGTAELACVPCHISPTTAVPLEPPAEVLLIDSHSLIILQIPPQDHFSRRNLPLPASRGTGPDFVSDGARWGKICPWFCVGEIGVLFLAMFLQSRRNLRPPGPLPLLLLTFEFEKEEWNGEEEGCVSQRSWLTR